jgi:hypothetical protein
MTKNWNPESSLKAKLQKIVFDSTCGAVKFHGIKNGSQCSVQIIEHNTGIILIKSESPDSNFIAFNASESGDYEFRNYTIFFDKSYNLITDTPLLSDAEKMFYELHRKELEEVSHTLKNFLYAPTKLSAYLFIKNPPFLGDDC